MPVKIRGGKVSKTGDTMTGDLTLNGANIVCLAAELIAGIINTNLLDKSAAETISGKYVHTDILSLAGNGRIQRHLIIDPKRFKMPAENYPGESFEGLFYTLDFNKSTEESAYAQEHVPFRWASTTNIVVEVDWFHDTGADTGAVAWGLAYKAIKEDEAVMGAGTTITQTSAGNHDGGVLVRTVFTSTILATNLEINDILTLRLFRDVTDEADTLDEDARVVNLHIYFIQDKLGNAT